MRRAISLLMMVVMVLAPCAIAHAASTSNHHSEMKQTAGHMLHGMQHKASKDLVHSHPQCPTGSKKENQSHCSNDCDTLRRVLSQSTLEAHEFKIEVVYPANIVPRRNNNVGNAVRSYRFASLSPIDARRDSKSVLRTTARLRL